MTAYCGKCGREKKEQRISDILSPCDICTQQTEPFFFEKEEWIKANKSCLRTYEISDMEIGIIQNAIDRMAKNCTLEKDRCWLISIMNNLKSQKIRKRHLTFPTDEKGNKFLSDTEQEKYLDEFDQIRIETLKGNQ